MDSRKMCVECIRSHRWPDEFATSEALVKSSEAYTLGSFRTTRWYVAYTLSTYQHVERCSIHLKGRSSSLYNLCTV